MDKCLQLKRDKAFSGKEGLKKPNSLAESELHSIYRALVALLALEDIRPTNAGLKVVDLRRGGHRYTL